MVQRADHAEMRWAHRHQRPISIAMIVLEPRNLQVKLHQAARCWPKPLMSLDESIELAAQVLGDRELTITPAENVLR